MYTLDWAKIAAYYIQLSVLEFKLTHIQCFTSTTGLAEVLAEQLRVPQHNYLLTADGCAAVAAHTRASAVKGLQAKAVIGTMTRAETEGALNWMQQPCEADEVKCVVCCNMWVEGIDIPLLDGVFSTRRAYNILVEAQRVGRVQRATDNKEYGVAGYLAPPSVHEATQYEPLVHSLYYKTGSEWNEGRSSAELVDQQQQLEQSALGYDSSEVVTDNELPEELAFD
jgi:superfamily II DNA or RNA helicase